MWVCAGLYLEALGKPHEARTLLETAGRPYIVTNIIIIFYMYNNSTASYKHAFLCAA